MILFIYYNGLIQIRGCVMNMKNSINGKKSPEGRDRQILPVHVEGAMGV
jgi:hypothetical protein